MTWTQQTIPSPLIEGVEELANAVGGVTQSVEGVLSAAQALLDVAKAFIATNVDPYSILFDQILTETENLVNDLFNTGIFQLYVSPFEVGNLNTEQVVTNLTTGISTDPTAEELKFIVEQQQANFQFDQFGIPQLTPRQVIQHMVRSFDDEGDLGRPQFSESAQVSAVGLIVTSASLDGFLDLLRPLIEVLNLRPFADILNKLVEKSTSADDLNPRKSRPPDWNNELSLSSIGILREQRDALIDLISLARGYVENADDALGDLLDVIDQKLTALRRVVDQFNVLIDRVINAVGASGIYVFSLSPTIGGNELLKTSLRDSELEALNQNGYSAGALFVGGGASLVPVNTLRELLT